MPLGTWRRVAVAAAACALLTPLGVAHADQTPLPTPADTVARPLPSTITSQFATTGRWLVELSSRPTVLGGSSTTTRAERTKLVSDADRADIPLEVTSTYDSLFNGVAVEADAEGAAALLDLAGVVAVYPVLPVAIPETQEVSPELYSAIGMTGADQVHSELGFTGTGIKVGIIDSGVDHDHPDLGGTGTDGGTFPTARVAHGWDFVGDDYNADPTSAAYQPVPQPDAVPDDCQGHGTHVAGIVGASGEVTGVAPDVTFGAYRVFGCEGSSDTEIILSALERALADGMDVVNMSLGASFMAWPEYPTGVASDRLVAAGVVVVASAGNNGDFFTQATGSPGAGRDVISVASYDNTMLRLDEIIITDDVGVPLTTGFLPASGSPLPSDALNGLPLVWTTDPIGCTEDADLSGTIAITSRGTCSFHEKAVAAQQAGASALIIANNTAGMINATVEGDTEITIPVITITQADGETIAAMLDDGVAPTFELTGEQTSLPNPTGGLVSDFSSWGLAADLTLKPDLGAPGGSIYSTVPIELGGFATNSGTSMAAPHVAGAVALMLDEEASLSPAQVLAELQNTAEPSLWSANPGAGVLDGAHHQGAGLIQVDKAIVGTSSVAPGKISAGESADGPHTETLTLRNDSDVAVTYTLSNVDALSTVGLDGWQTELGYAQLATGVAFSQAEVEVPAGGTATVDVTITADVEGDEGMQYSGFIFLQGAEGTDPLTVPYAGMVGDYGSLDVFPDLAHLGMDLPAVVVVEECGVWFEQQCIDPLAALSFAEAGHVYELGTDLPSVALHLAYPVLKLEIEALQVNASGAVVEDSARTVLTADRLGRDAELSIWSWDGRVTNDTGLLVEVDPGDYALRFTAHAADGDGGTQVWTSPSFGVKNAVEPTPEPTPTPTPTPPPFDLYTTPGYHHVNGRNWFTSCEPYSQTERCRTLILATQVTQQGAAFVAKTGWVFNNLTYVASPRQLWGSNPLANKGEWTAGDGREWRTDCDSAATGRGGCRSYAESQIITVNPAGGYRWTTMWVFNNMVRFTN